MTRNSILQYSILQYFRSLINLESEFHNQYYCPNRSITVKLLFILWQTLIRNFCCQNASNIINVAQYLGSVYPLLLMSCWALTKASRLEKPFIRYL